MNIKDRKEYGISPVVGIAILIAIAVILSALVFATTSGFMTEQQAPSAGANVTIASESTIQVQLDSVQNADHVYVKSPLGTRYELEKVGDTVEILNIGNEQKPVVIAEKDGKEQVVQGITPRSFDADYVVSNERKTLSEALNASSTGDVITVKRGTYSGDINIDKDVKVVAETGTTIDGTVTVKSSTSNVTLSNVTVTDNVTVEGSDTYLASTTVNGDLTTNPTTVVSDSDSLLRTTIDSSGSTTTSNSPPTASFTFSPSSPTTEDSISFDSSNSSDDVSINSYNWDFNNDGVTDATGQTVTHSFSASGDHNVNLTVTDDGGLTDSSVQTITVSQPVSAKTWETASEWDNATSESGVVHESVSNTDHNDASIVKMGYSIKDPYKENSLSSYLPLQEDGGGTAYDFSGNNNDGNNSGATPNANGILRTSAYSFEAGEYIDSNHTPETDSPFTWSIWAKTTDTDGYIMSTGHHTSSDGVHLRYMSSNIGLSGAGGVGSESYGQGSSDISDGNWHLLTATYDGGTVRLYVDGSKESEVSESVYSSAVDAHLNSRGIRTSDTHYMLNADMLNARMYNSALSASEIQSLYNIVGDTSTLTTNTKSFSSPVKPDLSNVDYTLNGQTARITVIGSPGTTDEETQTVSLDGSNSYDLTWDSAHSNYQIKLSLETSNVEETPTINSVEISGSGVTEETPTDSDETSQTGLVNHYSFETGSGSTVYDREGTLDGTLQDTAGGDLPNWVSGPVGEHAVYFDGQDTEVLQANGSSLDSPWTVSLWIKGYIDHENAQHYFSSDGPYNLKYEQYNNSGKLGFTKSGVEDYVFTDAPVPNGRWAHLVYTNDGSKTSIYIDGSLKDTHPKTIPLGRHTLITDEIKGTVDDIRIYNHSISQSKVQSLFEKGNTAPNANFTHSLTSGYTFSFDASQSSDEIGSIDSYEWDFDNNGTTDATGQTTSHTFASSGEHTVTLTVTDDKGETDTATDTINVVDSFSDSFEDGEFSSDWKEIQGPWSITTNSISGTYSLESDRREYTIITKRTFNNDLKMEADFNVAHSSGDFGAYINADSSLDTMYGINYNPAGTDNPKFNISRTKNGSSTKLKSKSPSIGAYVETHVTIIRNGDTIEVTFTGNGKTDTMTVTDSELNSGGHIGFRGYNTAQYDNVSVVER